MVEHHLAMVGVAGSNPVFRSKMKSSRMWAFFVPKINLSFLIKRSCKEKCICYNNICCRGSSSVVEHHLAMVGVAGSNPVFRSKMKSSRMWAFFVPKINLSFLIKRSCKEKCICYNNICCRGSSSVVEHHLAMVGVAGSNPVFRSKIEGSPSGESFFTGNSSVW